jgi:hypothetical protein
MSPEVGKHLAQRFVAALQALEREGPDAVPAMAALFGEGSRLVNPALESAGMERRGQEGAHAFWADYAEAFRGASTTFSHMTLGEGAIGLFWTTSGVPTAAGAPTLGYAGATLIEHDEAGVITGFRGYYDSQALKATTRPEA